MYYAKQVESCCHWSKLNPLNAMVTALTAASERHSRPRGHQASRIRRIPNDPDDTCRRKAGGQIPSQYQHQDRRLHHGRDIGTYFCGSRCSCQVNVIQTPLQTPPLTPKSSLITRQQTAIQILIIDAAIAGHVPRVIPSSFGIGTTVRKALEGTSVRDNE